MSGEELNRKIGCCVRFYRTRFAMTQKEVADLAGGGLTQAKLSELERGERRWNVDYLAAVACALRLAPRGLLPGFGDSGLSGPEAELILKYRNGGPRAVADLCFVLETNETIKLMAGLKTGRTGQTHEQQGIPGRSPRQEQPADQAAGRTRDDSG